MELAKNIKEKLNQIPKNVKIVAATKYVEAEDMTKLLSIGINHFGENRVDAFLKKYDKLKAHQICWHFIGHLQTNKAKEVLPKIDYLHSLDSLKLAKYIEKDRLKPLPCFVEINLNYEESKNGVLMENCESFLQEVKQYSKVHIIGFMMMSKKDSSLEEKQEQFFKLNQFMKDMNQKLGMHMQELSMGMSDDYEQAILSGSTMVRLGRMLWDQKK